MSGLEKLLVVLLVSEVKKVRKDCGIHCLEFIDNAHSAYTDFWAAYATVFPCCRHQAVGKGTGLTSYIERFNNTLRQRVSRLVRDTLSFSKKLQNHLGAI